jgi:hypothetical protein
MKKILPFLAIVTLLLVAACGGGDSTDEPTPSDEPTPPITAETPVTTEPECNTYYWFDNESTECGQKEFCGAFMYLGLQTFDTQAECESALAAMSTPTPPPPTQAPEAIEDVLADVMTNLLVAFTEVDGQWQAYTKAGVASLSSLNQGEAYYFFAAAATDLTTDLSLSKGWNPMKAWVDETATIASSLAGHEDDILIVVGWNGSAQQWELYQGSALTALTEIQSGQTYYTFEADSANPVSASWNTKAT